MQLRGTFKSKGDLHVEDGDAYHDKSKQHWQLLEYAVCLLVVVHKGVGVVGYSEDYPQGDEYIDVVVGVVPELEAGSFSQRMVAYHQC